ncbi:MAG TPA: hypothetical protein ENI39_03720 [Anaerolineae bacterium]|nr:hypothetical protein [Anaerolineae bacterium]
MSSRLACPARRSRGAEEPGSAGGDSRGGQFLNILKGEMSAVGPRPERPEFVEELAREIPFYRVRHAVKPGMAGWGLVKQGYGSSKEDALVKLQYDLYYIKHQSFWLDLVILLKTIVDTLTLRGR